MELGIEDKVVLVTGGSSGLGRALCRTLAEEGARVALCGRDKDRLAAAESELKTSGADAVGVVADVTRAEDLNRFVDTATQRWGRIDAIVNNAGRSAAKLVEESCDVDWEDDIDLKLSSAVRLVRTALPWLRESRGSIVNVLAIGAKTPGAGSTPSSVSRAAGMALTKALSKELGKDGIRVNAVLVGLIESGQWERRAAESNVDLSSYYVALGRDAGIPLGRVGKAQEFADLVTLLLSERTSYVTGTAINIDGGLCDVV
ncbi:MAG: SDR family oxidoreductase [Actinobacteria bacterium]|nr:SDR family oxidoreductase [Actinomycetota bacterium]MCL5444721.1 SDR family oxidoreductase [Actinomycetota bacterium]